MLKIGWFFLIYFVVGWVIDVIITFGLVVIAAYKDQKHNDKTKCLESFGNAIDDVDVLCAEEDNGRKGFGKLKAWLLGRLTWPISIPIGICYLWDAIKAADIEEED